LAIFLQEVFMPKPHNAFWIFLPIFAATLGMAAGAQSAESQKTGVEEIIHSVITHDNLSDSAFLAARIGLQMRVEGDGSGDLRGLLIKAPDFALASGFAYSIRHNSHSPDDEIHLSLYFRQCPDEARLVHDWKMPLEHLQLGDGTGSIARFTPNDANAIYFALIYHNTIGICEASFNQQVMAQAHPIPPDLDIRPKSELSLQLANAIGSIMQAGDLRHNQAVAAAFGLLFRKAGFRETDGSAGRGQLLLEQTAPGIDAEFLSYVVQDTGWQTLYPFAQKPEILVNRNVAIHLPLDTQVVCITPRDVSRALMRAGVAAQMTQPGRNVLRWDRKNGNTLSLMATRKGACIEAFDLNQITDTAHALPETAIFRLPHGSTPTLGAGDKALIERIVYRLRSEPHSNLDFIAQLPATAQLTEFERMDAWMAALREAFAQKGIPEDAMEFHLYPPAAAGTPPRVFLMALRGVNKCARSENEKLEKEENREGESGGKANMQGSGLPVTGPCR
jgi:hypothetical protein